MKNIIISLLITFGIVIYACSSDQSSTSVIDYKKEVPKTVTEKIILPSLEDLLSKTNALKTAIDNFAANTNETQLETSRNRLIEAYEAYAGVYIFNIGEVKNKFMNRRLNSWPVFNIAIENNITSGNFDQSTISSLGSAAKNLPGLNYLLFKNTSVAEQLLEFQNNSNRLDFLVLLSDEFHSKITELHQIWSATGQNYASTFSNNEQEGLASSFNMLYNGLYNVIDNCKVTKVGKPGGLENSNFTNPEIVENYYTGNSLDLILKNLESIEDVFFNDDITSISDYINFIAKNDTLSNNLQTKITNAKLSVTAINTPLKLAVETQPVKVKKLHDDLNEVLVLMHNDIRSILSIIITGTDNDGD
ncbi:MAG: imelysin family protein [Flavobacteriaceae bacterium]|nr:imelysin family protein [Flavobacteriaceae bacterium]